MRKLLLSVCFALLIAVVLSVGVCTSALDAAPIDPAGKCGVNVEWRLNSDTGVLEIRGQGDMKDYNLGGYGCSPWRNRIECVKSIVIGEGVTSIGEYAFAYCSNLTSVNFPGSLTKIGRGAFTYSTSISNICIPESVGEIGIYAFRGCTSLENIKLPSKLKEIASDTFSQCRKLSQIEIPFNVLRIGAGAFAECESLETVQIPENVMFLDDDAFWSCTNLKSIVVSKNNKQFSNDEYGVLFNKQKTELIKFPSGNSAESYMIPDSVTSIASFAFCNSKNLESVEIPNGVIKIGEGAFSNCTNLSSVKIPDSVTSVGGDAFHDCTNLMNICLSKSLKRLSYGMFTRCESIASIDIPYGVETIGGYSFVGCNKLENVEIPNSVNRIDSRAFYNCTNLKSIYYHGTKDQWKRIIIGENAISESVKIIFLGNKKITLTVPENLEVRNTGEVKAIYSENGIDYSTGIVFYCSDKSILEMSVSGNVASIKALKPGEVTITATHLASGILESKKIIVEQSTFEEYFAQNINHYYPFAQDKFGYSVAVDLFDEHGLLNKAIAYKCIDNFALRVPTTENYNYMKAYYEMLLLSIITKQYADDEYSESLEKKAIGLAESIIGEVADVTLGTDMKAILGKMKASSVVSSLLSPSDITSVVFRLDNDIDNFKSEKELATALATQITIMQNREGLVSCLKLMAEFCESSGEAEIPGGLYDAIIKTINQIETTEIYIDYSQTGNLDVKSLIVNTFNDFTIRLWDNLGKLFDTVANAAVPGVGEMLLARDVTSFAIECVYPCGNISDCVWQLACIDIIGTYADAAFVRAKNNYNANPTLNNAKAVLGTYDFLLSTTDCGQNQLKLFGRYHYNCGIWNGIFADEKKADYETWIEYAESTDVGVRYNQWIRDNIALEYGFEKKIIVPVTEITLANGKVTNTEQNIIPYNSTYYFKKDSPMIPASLKDVFYITSVSDCYYDKEFTKPYKPTAITEPLTLYRKVTLVKNPNIINNYLNTDIKAYIDGKPIESYNIDGNTVVIVENLMEYGFDVLWDGAKRTLAVTDVKKDIFSKYQHGTSIGQIGIPMGYVYKTDIKTYVNGKQVKAYNIGGMTAIQIDDLGAFGNVKWDGDERAISFNR